MEISQKLGIRVFFYYLYERIIIGIILTILSFIFLSYKSIIITKISFIFGDKSAGIMNSVIIIFFTISLFVLLVGIITSWLKYISFTFMFGDNAFSIKRGIFNKKEVSIPYRHIQNVSIEQSLSNKTMGVCKLVILTAGSDNNNIDGEAEGIFDIIDSDIAQNIKNNLLQRLNVGNTNI